ncbi:MAG: response regulator [Ferruginibacter sp.]
MELLEKFFTAGYMLDITLSTFNGCLLIAIVSIMIFIALIFFKSRLDSSRNSNDALKHQVAALQGELDYIADKEVKARADAERSVTAKEKMLSSLSHEIRTPMNGILGMTTLLEGTGLSTEQREYIDTIISSGKILLSKVNEVMMNDKLEHSKINAAYTDLRQNDTDLNNCIEEVLDMFAEKAAVKKIELLYEIGASVPVAVISDSNRVQQVLINLVEQVMITDKKEVFVGVHLLKNAGEDVPMLGFEVTDVRIDDPARMSELLHSGESLPDDPEKSADGTEDFGLAISKKLVTDMGGQISRVNRSNFIFSISINTAPLPKVDPSGKIMPGFDGQRVLIVNNNLTAAFILKNQLEQWNLLPEIAATGEAAMKILAQSNCSLVITDMEMPGMNGIDLAKELRSKYPDLPVILLNPVNDIRHKQDEAIFGELFIVTKPVKKHILFDSILSAFRSVKKGSTKFSVRKLSEDFSKQYPLKILIAEDNPVNQKWAIKILNKMGYQPAIAGNGHIVLDMVGQETYDLILMDVQMPEMDGMEATKMIRLCLTQQPVVIAMTANVMHGDRLACMQAGMDDYISKPVELKVLVNMLEKWALLIKERKQAKLMI